MKNLYEILGVQPGASPAELKAAFRSLAQKHHPDREGGSIEAFQEINAAYEVLSDEVRRKRYDETGETKEGPGLDSVAISIIAMIFDSIIEDKSFYGDIVEAAKKRVKSDLANLKTVIEKKNKELLKLTKLCNRVMATGENLFAMVLENKLNHIQLDIGDAELKSNVLNAALKMLDTHNDEAPTKPEMVMPKFGHGFADQSMINELLRKGFMP